MEKSLLRTAVERWTVRVLLFCVSGFIAVYVGDLCVYKMRSSPQCHVTVNRYLVIPLKGNKQEYDDLGSVDEACAVSLFSQDGMSACWRLRRHPTEFTRP